MAFALVSSKSCLTNSSDASGSCLRNSKRRVPLIHGDFRMMDVADQLANGLVGDATQHVEDSEFQGRDLHTERNALTFHVALRGIEHQRIQVACILGQGSDRASRC